MNMIFGWLAIVAGVFMLAVSKRVFMAVLGITHCENTVAPTEKSQF